LQTNPIFKLAKENNIKIIGEDKEKVVYKYYKDGKIQNKDFNFDKMERKINKFIEKK